MPPSAGGQRSVRRKLVVAFAALVALAATVFFGGLAAYAIRESVMAAAREGSIQSVRIDKSRVVTAQAALDVHRVVIRVVPSDLRGGAVDIVREHGFYEEADARKEASGLRVGERLSYFISSDGRVVSETRRTGRAAGLSLLALLCAGAAVGLGKVIVARG